MCPPQNCRSSQRARKKSANLGSPGPGHNINPVSLFYSIFPFDSPLLGISCHEATLQICQVGGAEHLRNFEQNRARLRSIIEILKKIAFPRGASSKFCRYFVQNRAPVPSIFKILTSIALPCGASSKFCRSFVQNRAPVRSILKTLKKIALPCGASSKFH